MILSTKNSYTDAQKTIACNINYKGPAAYKYLRDDLNLHLPSSKSLFNYNFLKQISPGFDSKLIQSVRNILDEKRKQLKLDNTNVLEIILIFDEITLRRELVFNPSKCEVDGFEDLGFYRNNVFGKEALVFMIVGLNFDLEYPLNYFISATGIKGTICHEILKENLRICSEDLDVCVRGVSSDQGSNFRKSNSIFKVRNSKIITNLSSNLIIFKVIFIYCF